MLTAVLCLAIDEKAQHHDAGGRHDLARAQMLLASLRARMDVENVLEEPGLASHQLEVVKDAKAVRDLVVSTHEHRP